MAGSDINDTVGRIRDLLLSQSKAGRLRSLLDSVYGATEPVRRIPGMLGQFMGDAAPGGALNPELTPENMRTAAEYAAMTPNPIGDVASLGLAADDLRKGDYGSAALNSVGLLPFVPAMGAMISPKIFGKATGFDKSAMVDKSDTLVPLYHGGKALEEGLPNRGTGIYGEGLYLTGSSGRAGAYTKSPGSATYQVYANIRNPISSDDFRKRFGIRAFSPEDAKKVTELLKTEGYDGVVSKHGDDVWEAVSFYPERDVKSAISGISGKQQVKAKDDLYLEALERKIR